MVFYLPLLASSVVFCDLWSPGEFRLQCHY